MRKIYGNILKKCFYRNLVQARVRMELTQSKMADKLAMDDRSYINLEHGKSCCSAVTLVLFLLYCCDSSAFLEEMRYEIEKASETAA